MWPRTRRDGSFDDSNLQVGTSFAEHVRSAQTAGSCTDNDNVAFGVGVQVLEVATSHGTGNLALADGIELEGFPSVNHVLEGFGSTELHVSIAIDGFGRHGAQGR